MITESVQFFWKSCSWKIPISFVLKSVHKKTNKSKANSAQTDIGMCLFQESIYFMDWCNHWVAALKLFWSVMTSGHCRITGFPSNPLTRWLSVREFALSPFASIRWLLQYVLNQWQKSLQPPKRNIHWPCGAVNLIWWPAHQWKPPFLADIKIFRSHGGLALAHIAMQSIIRLLLQLLIASRSLVDKVYNHSPWIEIDFQEETAGSFCVNVGESLTQKSRLD